MLKPIAATLSAAVTMALFAAAPALACEGMHAGHTCAQMQSKAGVKAPAKAAAKTSAKTSAKTAPKTSVKTAAKGHVCDHDTQSAKGHVCDHEKPSAKGHSHTEAGAPGATANQAAKAIGTQGAVAQQAIVAPAATTDPAVVR